MFFTGNEAKKDAQQLISNWQGALYAGDWEAVERELSHGLTIPHIEEKKSGLLKRATITRIIPEIIEAKITAACMPFAMVMPWVDAGRGVATDGAFGLIQSGVKAITCVASSIAKNRDELEVVCKEVTVPENGVGPAEKLMNAISSGATILEDAASKMKDFNLGAAHRRRAFDLIMDACALGVIAKCYGESAVAEKYKAVATSMASHFENPYYRGLVPMVVDCCFKGATIKLASEIPLAAPNEKPALLISTGHPDVYMSPARIKRLERLPKPGRWLAKC